MGIFSDLQESTVFRDENVLAPEYLPAQLPHREGQIQQIADCIKPALSGRRPHNCFIFGPPGIGKTAVTKHIFSELSEFANITPVYVNCWEYNTSHAAMSRILSQLGGIAPRRGVAADELFERLLGRLKQKVPIIALDEADQLINRDGSKLLYDLVRSGRRLGVIAISNDQFIGRKLDARVKSSLAEEEISFKPYTERELRDIVNQRVERAFRKTFYEPSIIPACAKEAASRGGDVRFALECLSKAGRDADTQGSKLTLSQLQSVFDRVGNLRTKQALSSLLPDEKSLLKILSRHKQLLSGELYAKYAASSKNPVAERTFRVYLNHLKSLDLLSAEFTSKGFRGNSRILRPKIDPKLLN